VTEPPSLDHQLVEHVIALEQLYDALSFAGAKLYRSPHKEALKPAIRREITLVEDHLDQLLAQLAGETVNITNIRKYPP